MKNSIMATVAVGLILAFCFGAASATDVEDTRHLRTAMPLFDMSPGPVSNNGARLETLWIFDADYSTLTGDNAGWTTWDRSGTLASENFWHHDTIRIGGYTHLGDSTWWCGTYNDCWRQPRGYGNDWLQILERHFDEHMGLGGTSLILEYDQRLAMENNYDYGYVDLRSPAQGDTWRTVVVVDNPGFAGTPGLSQDWNSTNPLAPGHMTVDISDYVTGEFDMRFRFDSDLAYSSQDQFDNPPQSSVKDGAWQLDNITLLVDGAPVFVDDAESGNMGWIHDDVVASGQTGVTFWRGQFGIDFVTGRAFTCDDRPVGTWMYADVDPFTSTMVDDEVAWLMSPPIDISGAQKLVGHWDFWLDMPRDSEDICNLELASNDAYECVTDPSGFVDENPGWWYGDAGWRVRYDDWDAFAGNDWLATLWIATNDGESAGHWAGILMNQQRVGIPSGDGGTIFEIDTWNTFNDWYIEQLSDALTDTMYIGVKDDDGVASVTLMASNDGGQTWDSYVCRHESEQSQWWYAPPPSAQMTVGSEIWMYFETLDMVGNTAIWPEDAPDHYLEMSILPINASVSNPGLLLVDKHGRVTPGETRSRDPYPITRPLIEHHSEYYWVEMLEILGYEWDTYDVNVPSGSIESQGPDTMAYKYYDTQIWFFNEFNAYLLWPEDQENLITWLNQAGGGKERNLILSGNDVGFELMETGKETLGFYNTWLASNYLSNTVGVVTVDSVPTIRERAGGAVFLSEDDGEAILAGGCPNLSYYDVVEPYPGIAGTEVIVDYVKSDASTEPGGVAYTHQTLNYQTVNVPFALEFVMGGRATSPQGHFVSGVHDRTNILSNIMNYVGETPGGVGTGIDGSTLKNTLSHAYPNPFNPSTKIAYSVKEGGPVTIEVFNVAGKVVRTLLDTEVDAGASGFVVWDGTNDAGENCASGVYFYSIASQGYKESHKMIMLK